MTRSGMRALEFWLRFPSLLLVAFSYFFRNIAVFYYEDTLIAAVKAFPDGRAVEDEKIDVC